MSKFAENSSKEILLHKIAFVMKQFFWYQRYFTINLRLSAINLFNDRLPLHFNMVGTVIVVRKVTINNEPNFDSVDSTWKPQIVVFHPAIH